MNEEYVYNKETDEILQREGYKYVYEMPKYTIGNGYELIEKGEKCLKGVGKTRVGSKESIYLYRDMMYVEVETSYGIFEYATHLELFNFDRDSKKNYRTKVYKYGKKDEKDREMDIEYIYRAIKTLTSLVGY